MNWFDGRTLRWCPAIIGWMQVLCMSVIFNTFVKTKIQNDTMENKEQKKNELQIQLKPEVADGKYSNLAMIGHGPNEFIIDFIFAAPGMPQAPVVSRVVMTPENAKQLMFALTDNVQKYEKTFGTINQKRPSGNGGGMPPFGAN